MSTKEYFRAYYKKNRKRYQELFRKRRRMIMQDPNHPDFEKECDLWEAKTYRELTRLENNMWKKVTDKVRVWFR